MAVSHKCPNAALLSIFGLSHILQYAPSPSISMPCIWTLLRHLTVLCLNIYFWDSRIICRSKYTTFLQYKPYNIPNIETKVQLLPKRWCAIQGSRLEIPLYHTHTRPLRRNMLLQGKVKYILVTKLFLMFWSKVMWISDIKFIWSWVFKNANFYPI